VTVWSCVSILGAQSPPAPRGREGRLVLLGTEMVHFWCCF